MKALGLNPAEQETIDMTNEVGCNGQVYFPDFCKIVLRKYREDDKEVLNQTLFKVDFLMNFTFCDFNCNQCMSYCAFPPRLFVALIRTLQTSEQKSTKSRTNSLPKRTSSS